jgi:hypothetical protein
MTAMPSSVEHLFGRFTDGGVAGQGSGARPMPLVETTITVEICGGLAEIATRRVFRNDEPQSIEATITFPASRRELAKESSRDLQGAGRRRGRSTRKP